MARTTKSSLTHNIWIPWTLWGLGLALLVLLFVVASQVPAYPQIVPGPAPSAPTPPTSTVIGNLQTATGGTVTNGTLNFTLSQPAVVSGTSSVAASTVSCYTSTVGNLVGVPDPLATPILSVNLASGTLPPGTYFVKITYVGAGGQSVPSPEASITLSGAGTLNVAAPALQPTAATGFYSVYIGTTSGGETLQGTATSWTTFAQSAALAAGAALPSSNTSACSVWFSDTLIPTGTFYTVSLFNKNGSQLAGFPQTWCTYGGAGGTINVSNGAPTGNCGTNGVFYPTPIFAVPANGAAQSISGPMSFPGGVTGNTTFSGNETFTGTVNVKTLNAVQFCDQFSGATADVKIAAAIAALPAAGGTVDCRGFGATTQTIAATTTVGALTQLVTLLVDRATFYQCTITNGSACWQIYPGSAIVGFGPGNSVGATVGFGVSNSASISNVIKAIAAGGTNRPLLDNIAIPSNSSATVSDSVVSLGDVLDGTSINNLSIGGYASTYLLKIVTASAASSGPTNINNVSLNCVALTGCKPLLVDSVANNAVLGGINFFGGSITHPGSGGLALATLQDTGAAGLNQGVNFYGTQFESSNAADIGVFCNGCRGLTMIGTLFTAGASVGTDCIRISGNAAAINLENINNFNGWTNTLNNQVNSTVLTSSTTILSHYTYMRFTTTSNALWEDNTGTIFGIDSTNSVRSARAIVNSETTAPSGQANKDVCYGDSSAHAVKCSYNNGTFFSIPQVITATSGAIAYPTTAGTCATGTVAVTGSTTGMAVSASPSAQTGNTVSVQGYVSTGGTVTISICAVATTSAQSQTFNVRVTP